MDTLDAKLLKIWSEGPALDPETKSPINEGWTPENIAAAKKAIKSSLEIVFEPDSLHSLDTDAYPYYYPLFYGKKSEFLYNYPKFRTWKRKAANNLNYNKGYDDVLSSVQKSFDQDYKDKFKRVDKFLREFIYDFGMNWHNKEHIWPDGKTRAYYSPYCSIIQSSGSGKTRFIFELGKKCCMIYVCLRDVGDVNGFPFRSSITDELEAQLSKKPAEHMNHVFKSFFLAISEVLDEVFEQRKNESDESVYQIIQQMLGEITTPVSGKSIIGEQFWGKVKAKMSLHKDVDIMNFRILIGKLKHLKNKPICFSFDEARKLLRWLTQNENSDAFRECRRTLAQFMHAEGEPIITAIFTDTNSKVSNFSGPAHYQASLRTVEEKRHHLYHPYWTIPGWTNIEDEILPNCTMKLDRINPDVMALDTPETIEQIENDFLANFTPSSVIHTLDASTNLDYVLWLYSYGRPLWKGYIENLSSLPPLERIRKIREISRIKLTLPKANEPLSNTQIISVLDSRLCLAVNGCTTVASALVAEHMSICYYISDTRDFIVTGYPIEPLVTAASISWIHKIPLREQIDCMIESIAEGVVPKGYRGELLSKFLLTTGFDKARIEYLERSVPAKSWSVLEDTVPVDVGSFLKTTYGEKFIKEMERSCNGISARTENLGMLLNGTVRINKWIKADTDDVFDNAELLYRFGIAIITKESSKGKDKMIPVRLFNGGYTWIIIEDKNNENDDKTVKDANSTYSMIRTFSRIPERPYLVIYCQFGDSGNMDIENKFFSGPSSSTRSVSKIESDQNPQPQEHKVYADKQYKFIVAVNGLSYENYPFLEHLNTEQGYDIIENLRLLRDGTFRIENESIQENLSNHWDELKFKHQVLHDIIKKTARTKRTNTGNIEAKAKKRKTSSESA